MKLLPVSCPARRRVIYFVYLALLTGWLNGVASGGSITNLLLYSDAGILTDSKIFTWPDTNDCSRSKWDGRFADAMAPEGTECFKTESTCPYVGWGIFKSLNLSPYTDGQIRFWLKSSKQLRFELEGPQFNKRGTNIPSTTNAWREIVLPVSFFAGVDLTRLFGAFLLTSVDGPATFSVDHVRWSTLQTDTPLPRKGEFYGLFSPTAGATAENSGFFEFHLTDRGTFTGTVRLMNTSLGFKSGFDSAGEATVTVKRPGGPPFSMLLQLLSGGDAIGGAINIGTEEVPHQPPCWHFQFLYR